MDSKRTTAAHSIIARGKAALLCLLVLVVSLPVAAQMPTVASPVEGDTTSASPSALDTEAAVSPERQALRHQRNPVVVPAEDKKKKKNRSDEVSRKLRGATVVSMSGDTIHFNNADSLRGVQGALIVLSDSTFDPSLGHLKIFNPDPKRAMWLSALCPGLGQIYNRRYWKLPIIVGAFVGLGYGTAWNNRMLSDYSRAYRDAMDSDPNTRSYMNFYPPTTNEADLDMAWLQRALKNKKDNFRRYRDLCVIGMVGVYLLSVLDAYVDASLAHFDISPDLTMQVKPAVFTTQRAIDRLPSVGLQCAVNF